MCSKALFGGGGSIKPVEVAPTPQAVDTNNVSAEVGTSEAKKKRRQGFSSTQASVLTDTSTENRTTLG